MTIKLYNGTTFKGRTKVTKIKPTPAPMPTGVTRIVDGYVFELVAVIEPMSSDAGYPASYAPRDSIDETSYGYLRDDLWQEKINGKDYRIMATQALTANLDPNTNDLSGFVYTSPRSEWLYVQHSPDLSLAPGPYPGAANYNPFIHIETTGTSLGGSDYSQFSARSCYVRMSVHPEFYGNHGGDTRTGTLNGYVRVSQGIAVWVSV